MDRSQLGTPRWTSKRAAMRATRREFATRLAERHTYVKVGRYWYRQLN